MSGADTTLVGQARVAGWQGRPDVLAARLKVAHTLAGADLRPSGLSPAAVLIVRRLDARMTGRLALHPGNRIDLAWERTARQALADLVRRAVRPWDNSVPPRCAAVLFRDEAELLACLALDISQGRAGERWWWQTYWRRWGSLGTGVLPAVLMDGSHWTPAALRLLHERSQAAPVMQNLAPAATRQVLSAICQAFGAASPNLAASGPEALAPQRPSADRRVAEAGALDASPAPWRVWLAEEVAELAPESVCLLGVALILAHAPAQAQSAGFPQAVERWWRAELRQRNHSVGLRAAAAQAHTAVGPDVSGLESVDTLALLSAVLRPDKTASLQVAVTGQRPDTLEPSTPALQGANRSGVAQEPTTTSDGGVDVSATQRRPVSQSDIENVSSEAAKPAAAAPGAKPADWLDGVVTELGGALFLINIMQRLDLPGCFERDWRLASQVGPWGVLELLARSLLAWRSALSTTLKVGNAEHLTADPLWSPLAALAGRVPGDLPGAHFVALNASLRVPAAWSHWLGHEAAKQVIELSSIAPLVDPLLASVSDDMRRWLAAVTPLLGQMVRRALGDGTDLAGDLLLRRGRLYVTSSCVDLVLPLESVSMPVRMAGLDFDPGWLPAFGRVIRFHYRQDCQS
jgi:hypothetical protein